MPPNRWLVNRGVGFVPTALSLTDWAKLTKVSACAQEACYFIRRTVAASQRSPLPGSPAKATGALFWKVAELPCLEVETRQLGDSGPADGSGALGGAAECAGVAERLGLRRQAWARRRFRQREGALRPQNTPHPHQSGVAEAMRCLASLPPHSTTLPRTCMGRVASEQVAELPCLEVETRQLGGLRPDGWRFGLRRIMTRPPITEWH